MSAVTAETSPETDPLSSFLSQSLKDLKTASAREGWSLNEAELSAVQAHFKPLRREPTPSRKPSEEVV